MLPHQNRLGAQVIGTNGKLIPFNGRWKQKDIILLLKVQLWAFQFLSVSVLSKATKPEDHHIMIDHKYLPNVATHLLFTGLSQSAFP